MSVIYGSYYSIHQGKDVTIRSLCHSVPHHPMGGEVSPQREHTNAHRPRAPRKHSLRGWNLGGGCRALRDGGWGISPKPLAKGEHE